ncbi:helix-hairpin-helix domain-containing protein [Prochlorococcus sp. MIT 1341]|uniref:helix-hairpin-helix domain-containing protein n=1 Tax=Prochlorococcus sp. MIT 1341 TaxID=3096221 RepID=UPI002A766AB3|nr:helix-hairpin-helix domain-containing protein [Prochlorococcus sp. MIT 1341]
MNLLSKVLKRISFQTKPLSHRDISDVIALNKSQLQPKQNLASAIESKPIPENKEEKEKSPNYKTDDLMTLPGVGPKVADLLLNAGYKTASDVLSAPSNDLIQIKGIGRTVLKRIKNEN